jgi:hypothetical protein
VRVPIYSSKTILTTILTASSLLISLQGFQLVQADSKNEGVFAIDSKPYGVSYEDWTIKYWQWLLSMPVDVSPRTDTTGERCTQEQEDSPVFFLVGAGGGVVERTCTVPAGKAILVPVAHVECSFAEFSEFGGETEEKLHTCAEEDQSSNPLLFLSVDGREFKELDSYRIHSRAFDVNFPSNALFGAKAGPSRAVSDGYWIILEPLPVGEHEIHFKNTLTNPKTGALFFSDDIKYHLIVE